MQSLLTLARFVSAEEQQEVAKRIAEMGFSVRSDDWAPQRRLIVDGEATGKLFEVEGVSQVIPLIVQTDTKTLSEAAGAVAAAAKQLNLSSFTVRLKCLGDVPFHEKALRERVHKKTGNSPGRTLYVEARPMPGCVAVRVGMPEVFHEEKRLGAVLVLESPKTPHEIADFIRLSVVFGAPLYISIENDVRTLHALQDAKAIVKGHEKTQVTTFRTTLDAIKGRKAAAFSMWGDSDEKWLKTSGVDALVFGNEERGLKLSTQKACAGVVHLGPHSSEPMRATQAAAYALGVLA